MASFSVKYIFSLVDKFSAGAGKMAGAAKGIQSAMHGAGAAARSASAGLGAVGVAASAATAKIHRMAQSMRAMRTMSMGMGIGGGMGTMLAFPIAHAIKRYADYESKLIDIRKVWMGSEADYGRMVAKLKELNALVPLTRAEIATLMEEGVRAGIGLNSLDPAKDLEDFTRIAAQFSVAFKLPIETAAAKLAKLQSQLGMTAQEFVALGDAMNTLAGTSATNEQEMLEYINRVGGLAKSIGGAKGLRDIYTIGSAQMAAGTLKEVAATGMRTLLARLSTQPKDTQKALAALGLDPEVVKKGLTTDLYGTVRDIFHRISKLPEHMKAGTLAQLAGLKSFDAFVRLLANLDLLDKQRATVMGKDRLTMQAEYERRLTSLNSLMQITSNVMSDLSDSIVSQWRPQLAWLLSSIQGLSANLEGNSWMVWGAGVLGAAAAISLILMPLGMLGMSLYSVYLGALVLGKAGALLWALVWPLRALVGVLAGGVIGGAISGIAGAFASLGRATALAYRFAGALGVATMAFRSLRRVLGIGLAIEGLMLLYQNWEKVKQALQDPLTITINWPEMPPWLKGFLEANNATNDQSTPGEGSWLRQKMGAAAEWIGLGPAQPQGAQAPGAAAEGAKQIQLQNDVRVQTDFQPATINVTGQLDGVAGLIARIQGSGQVQANRGVASSEAGAVTSAPAP